MNYLAAKNLTKYYGERLLFEDLTFGIAQGDKIAFIADNGSGKSTLLKILVAKEVVDEGEITRHKDIRIGYLSQDPTFDPTLTVNQLIESTQSSVSEIINRYYISLEQHSKNPSGFTRKELEQASVKMDQVNGWDYDRKVKIILSKFNIRNLETIIGTLSGGEQKRLALGLVLLDNPDLLILDEPTNHLDLSMIEWLESYLSQSKSTLLMVTHDRYFLDEVCNHIWELHLGNLYHHRGNYAYYLEKKAAREEVNKTVVEKAKKMLSKELEWMRRSPKARTTKAKARIHAFYNLKEVASKSLSKSEIHLDVKMKRLGGKILELKNVSKSFGDLNLVDDFSYTFSRGDRIGIVGDNGSGKSTFLNILANHIPIDQGKIRRGDTLQIGYYTQSGLKIKEEQRVIDVLKEVAEVITLSNGRTLTASQVLQHFMFSPQMQFTPVSKLSGGEKRRLHLLRVLMQNPNFLILDEPTNDLDLATLNKLEDFLTQYTGCLVMVSHDRYFLDNLVDHLFVFQGNGKIKGYISTYSEYRAQLELESLDQPEKHGSPDKKQIDKEEKEIKRKLEIGRRREFNKLEKQIDQLEKNKKDLEVKINQSGLDLETLQQISAKIGQIIKDIDDKTETWMQLGEDLDSA